MVKQYVFILLLLAAVGVANASLEDILAPLPEPVAVAIETDASEHVSAPTAPVEEIIYPITSADLQESLQDALMDMMRPETELTLIPLGSYPDLRDYSKPFTIRLISAPGRLSRANMLLRFQVENVKGLIGEYAVPFKAHLYADVFYVQSDLQAGEIASLSDFNVRRADLLVESSAIPADPKILERHEYSRNLNSGRALQWGDLKVRSVIRKGEMVEVFARSGLLAISTRAVARQDGAEGDFIVLRNLDSNKEFSGLVVAENQVQVKF